MDSSGLLLAQFNRKIDFALMKDRFCFFEVRNDHLSFGTIRIKRFQNLRSAVFTGPRVLCPQIVSGGLHAFFDLMRG